MSLIHEALQKAEKERRAGELPPLLSSAPGIRRRETSGMRPLWYALSLALLAAVAYSNRDLILSDSREAEVAPVVAEADETEAAAPPLATSRSAGAARKPDSVARPQVPAAPAAPAMDAFTAAQADAIAAHLGAGRGIAPESQAPLPEPEPTPPVERLPAPIPVPVLPQEQPQAAVVPDAAADAAQAGVSLPEDAREGAAPNAPKSPAPVPAATSPQDDSGTPLIYELPLGTRQSLPPLKVTMQVYHQDPTLRFAIIDGKRVNENGVVGNELNLIEIQRDAMLFEYRGTRFLLPRLGR